MEEEYRNRIAYALQYGDYQRALELYREYHNDNIRALREVQTMLAFEEYFQSAWMDEIKLFGKSTDFANNVGKVEANGRF